MRAAIKKAIFLFSALILSGALWRLFSTGGQSSTDGDPRTQIALTVIYAIVAILMAFRFRDAVQGLLRNPALVCLLLLACLSPLWAESPDLVLRRALGLVGATLFGVVLATYYSFEGQLDILRWVFRIGATATLLLFIVSPSRALSAPGGGGGIRGVFPHKNILGAAMALAFLVEWYLREQQIGAKLLRLFWLCVYGALLLASDSMTSIVTIGAALTTVWTFRALYTRFQIPAWMLGLFLTVGIGAAAITGISTADMIGLLGRSSDLTGRTELWSAVYDSIFDKPLLGFGFSGFWKGASSSSDNVQGQIDWAPMYSHNGYLEITLSLGLVGLLLIIWVLATLFKRSWRQAEDGHLPLDSWPLAVFFFIVIHNMAECMIAWQNCLEWSVCVAALIACDPRYCAVLVNDHEGADESIKEDASLPDPECV